MDNLPAHKPVAVTAQSPGDAPEVAWPVIGLAAHVATIIIALACYFRVQSPKWEAICLAAFPPLLAVGLAIYVAIIFAKGSWAQ